eukprot:5728285-Alexandrium_andersonii.AAC.1
MDRMAQVAVGHWQRGFRAEATQRSGDRGLRGNRQQALARQWQAAAILRNPSLVGPPMARFTERL